MMTAGNGRNRVTNPVTVAKKARAPFDIGEKARYCQFVKATEEWQKV